MQGTNLKTILGGVWASPHTAPNHGLSAAPFQVKEVPEQGVVVIVAQDGVSGCEESKHGKKLLEEADKLLKLRWEGTNLLDLVIGSPEFSKGDFKASIQDAFSRVDEVVAEFVKTMDNTVMEWGEELVWRALFNSVVVIVTGKAVHVAGAGSFHVCGLTSDALEPLFRSDCNLEAGFAKQLLAMGRSSGLWAADCREEVERASGFTFDDCYRKGELTKLDKCVVVELYGPHSRSAAYFLRRCGKDWGAALTQAAEDHVPGMYHQSILLELRPVQHSNSRHTSQVPASSPGLATVVVREQNKPGRPSKRHGAMDSSVVAQVPVH